MVSSSSPSLSFVKSSPTLLLLSYVLTILSAAETIARSDTAFCWSFSVSLVLSSRVLHMRIYFTWLASFKTRDSPRFRADSSISTPKTTKH